MHMIQYTNVPAAKCFSSVAENNEDAVWLGLSGTLGWVDGSVTFLREPTWDIERNVKMILSE